MCNDCGKQAERVQGPASRCCQPRPVAEKNPCAAEYDRGHQQLAANRNPCIGDYEKHLYENEDEDICDRGPREPYQIPGYAGHVPTLQARSGGSYGHDTHKVLSSRAEERPTSFGKRSHNCPAPLHQPYHLPGYTGHVPGLQFMVGGSYGQDSHKLLYTEHPYPNRQENISPYRPQAVNKHFGNERSQQDISEEHSNSQYSNKPYTQVQIAHPEIQSSSDTYQKPKEYYEQPQYKYRIGDTYATTADLTLVDPCVNQESKVTLSTRELDDTQVVRTQNTLEERVQESPYINKPIRHRPMVPGFDAFVDAMRGARSQRFGFSHQSPSHQQLQQQLILQKGRAREPQRADDCVDGQDQHSQLPPQLGTGEVPYGYGKYGELRQKFTNSALYDFASNYRRRQSTEWAPATISRPDPLAFDIPGEIYNQHSGLLPGYSAHIPGSQFRCDFCPRNLDKKTTKCCTNCGRSICKNHLIEVCENCFSA